MKDTTKQLQLIKRGAVEVIQEDELKKYREHLEELVEERTAELKKSQEKYRQVIENSHDIFYALSPEGTLTFVSPQSTKLGFSPDEIIGHPMSEFIHPDDIESVWADSNLTLTTGQLPVTEFRLKKKDGTYIHVEETGEAIYEDGNIRQIIGSIRDITERKQAEVMLRIKERDESMLLQVVYRFPDQNQIVFCGCPQDFFGVFFGGFAEDRYDIWVALHE